MIVARVGMGRHLLSGAVAGAIATVGFAALHQLLISDIWASLAPMLVAGALCGVCVAWSYGRFFGAPSVGSWVRYNVYYVVLLALLGVASIVVFEPITTVPLLLAANEPPRELFRQAMPLTVAFILASAGLVWRLWGRTLLDGVAGLVTCTVLTLLLGLNVSVLGLVHLPSDTAYLVAELFGLIVALNAMYLASFLALERRRFRAAATVR